LDQSQTALQCEIVKHTLFTVRLCVYAFMVGAYFP
jgi:hypothetical protein